MIILDTHLTAMSFEMRGFFDEYAYTNGDKPVASKYFHSKNNRKCCCDPLTTHSPNKPCGSSFSCIFFFFTYSKKPQLMVILFMQRLKFIFHSGALIKEMNITITSCSKCLFQSWRRQAFGPWCLCATQRSISSEVLKFVRGQMYHVFVRLSIPTQPIQDLRFIMYIPIYQSITNQISPWDQYVHRIAFIYLSMKPRVSDSYSLIELIVSIYSGTKVTLLYGNLPFWILPHVLHMNDLNE